VTSIHIRARRKARESALYSRRDPTGFLALKGRRSQLLRNNNTNNKDEFIFLITIPRPFRCAFSCCARSEKTGIA